ncbi:MAG: hypothetical protein MI923_06690 [Phycisphaerales bacterium]|nr:hypothetical protein [Phycisphaerales bacterium]
MSMTRERCPWTQPEITYERIGMLHGRSLLKEVGPKTGRSPGGIRTPTGAFSKPSLLSKHRQACDFCAIIF